MCVKVGSHVRVSHLRSEQFVNWCQVGSCTIPNFDELIAQQQAFWYVMADVSKIRTNNPDVTNFWNLIAHIS